MKTTPFCSERSLDNGEWKAIEPCFSNFVLNAPVSDYLPSITHPDICDDTQGNASNSSPSGQVMKQVSLHFPLILIVGKTTSAYGFTPVGRIPHLLWDQIPS